MSLEEFAMSKCRTPIERLFYEQLVHKFEPEFCEAAEHLQVSDEQLKNAIESMEKVGSMGAAFAWFCRRVLAHRKLMQAAQLDENHARELLMENQGGALYRDENGNLVVRPNRG